MTHCAEALMTTRSKAKNRVTFYMDALATTFFVDKGEMTKFLVDWVTIPCAGGLATTHLRVAKVQIGTVFQKAMTSSLISIP